MFGWPIVAPASLELRSGSSSAFLMMFLRLSLRIQICPENSGFHLYSYSGDGIDTINPTRSRKGLDSWGVALFGSRGCLVLQEIGTMHDFCLRK